jgi:hypothetical protein
MNDYIPFNNESDLNPFIPIRKEPLESSDGTTSNRFSIQIEDLKTDSGWKEVGDVSKSYFLISNAEMRKVSEDITDASNMNFELDKTFFNGKVFYESWTTGDISSEVKHNEVGDPLIAGLMFQNSYDGSRKAAMWGFVKRLVCSNGMIANFLFKNWRFKHTRVSENWQDEIQRATSLLEHFPDRLDKFAEMCTRLTTKEVDVHNLASLRESRLNKLPDSAWGKVIDKFLKERQTDIGSFTQYDLLNACTSHFWHKKKTTVSDFDWNAYCVSGIINERFLKSDEERIKAALTIPEA